MLRAKTITVAILAAGAAITATAGTASAAPQPAPARTYTATTHLTNRPDGGAGGNTWALDNMTRTLTIKVTGTPGHYTDTATVTDEGTFTVIPGVLTPNQAPGRYAGDRIAARPAVWLALLTGTVHYAFTSAALPSPAPNLGVPRNENDHGGNPAGNQTTGNWYKQAFSSTAGLGGAGMLNNWGWDYTAFVVHGGGLGVQEWTDSYANGGGNLPDDGNVTG